jgi:hypothetical protein
LFNDASERLAIGNANGSAANAWCLLPLGLATNSQPSTNAFSLPTLVVVRIDHVGDSSDPDNAYVFFNPTLGLEPSTASAALSSVGVADYSFNRLRVFAGGLDALHGQPAAELRVDEIRIGETYRDVTPFENFYPSGPLITKGGLTALVENYAVAPLSGRTLTTYNPTNINKADQLGRLNFLRSEPANAPGSAARFFVCDNNRNLYILDETNRTFVPYINFEEVFPKFDDDPGWAGGLVTFQFDPGYGSNGLFYTVHTEDPAQAGPATPTNGSLPGLNVTGYSTTTAINPPAGTVAREAVLVEWRDTNVNNSTFEGTAREILRVGFNSIIHPMGDLLFNPLAQPGDADYRNLYLACGDGGAGEIAATRSIPQRLDALAGKILRLTPDVNLRTNDELSANGRYRIPTTGPDPNPFVSLNLVNLKKEVFAYGMRNCHRLSWDPVSNSLIENEIGLGTWEEINIVHKGANYGYSEREGTEQLFVGGANDGRTGSLATPAAVPFPSSDALIVTGIVGAVTPTYPVAMYSHRDGDAMGSGFVYRGAAMPQLYGKFIFNEVTTGRILYCDFGEMLAADDGLRTSVAVVHELQLVFDSPFDNPDQGIVNRRMFDLESESYTNRGGLSGSTKLPGVVPATSRNDIDGIPYGRGRADIRLAMAGDGELFILSKADGMIRRLRPPPAPNIISLTVSNSIARLTWQSIPAHSYRIEFKASLAEPAWSALAGDVTSAGQTSSTTNAVANAARFYRVVMVK